MLEVRQNLTAAHDRAWASFSQPGTWWTAAERCAIVEETRKALDCKLCRQRSRALSPEIDGAHDCLGILPEAAVDAVHRIRTHPGRLSRRWFEHHVAGRLPDAAFVELVGVLAIAVIIDEFDRAVGRDLRSLNDPASVEPTRQACADVVDVGAFVPIWSEDPGANIVRALGLVPVERDRFWDVFHQHYVANGHRQWDAGRAITRPQVELIAARVSAINQCFY